MRAISAAGTILAVIITAGADPATAQQHPVEHVVVVSIDGLQPAFYLDDGWPTPYLRRMAKEGAHARRVQGVFPTLTYPSHTTIVTGVLPIRHGVFYNEPFEAEGTTGLWYWSADSVRTPTIWEAARAAGLVTASILWPVTVDAPIDLNVPEAWPRDRSVSRLEFLRSVSTPSGLLDELEREATGRLVDRDADGPSDRWRYRFLDAKAIEMAGYLLSKYRPNLLTIHLLSVDDALHNGLQKPEVREALASVDALVGYLGDTIDRLELSQSTAFVIVGDHGFVKVDTLLAPNVWLIGEGLRGTKRSQEEWQASFHVKGGSAFLHVRDKTDKGIEAAVVHMLEGLPEHIRKGFSILSKRNLVALGADSSASLAIAARPGFAFSSAAEAPAVRPSSGATHGFLPTEDQGIYTGFVARGARIRRGASIDEMRLTDVAPLIASLLGVDFATPDGEVPQALIELDP